MRRIPTFPGEDIGGEGGGDKEGQKEEKKEEYRRMIRGESGEGKDIL